jgi:hypothetical protein
MESTTKSITESAEENLVVMYGLEATTKNIASSEITRKEATVQKSTKQLMEYTKEEESCAVLMENRGTLAERAASGWMDTVTGESSISSGFAVLPPPPPPPQSAVVKKDHDGNAVSTTTTPPPQNPPGGILLRPKTCPPRVEVSDLDTVNITKRMHLTNYKSILPQYGRTSITWPDKKHEAVSANFSLRS